MEDSVEQAIRETPERRDKGIQKIAKEMGVGASVVQRVKTAFTGSIQGGRVKSSKTMMCSNFLDSQSGIILGSDGRSGILSVGNWSSTSSAAGMLLSTISANLVVMAFIGN